MRVIQLPAGLPAPKELFVPDAGQGAATLPWVQPTPDELGVLELFINGAITGPLPSFAQLEEVTLRDRDSRCLAVVSAGKLQALALPRTPGLAHLRRSPLQVRAQLVSIGRRNVLAVELSDAIDLATEQAIGDEAARLDAAILLQVTRPWVLGPRLYDFACGRAAELVALRYLDPARTIVNLVPPIPEQYREQVHASFGATHLLVVEREEAPEYRTEVQQLLDELEPPAGRRGVCVWFTGLPSSGKSTIADALALMLAEHGRAVTMLDGDVVRTHLSKGLGFTREDRDINIARIGFVASEIVRHHGIVIAAAVSPYAAARAKAREYVESAGGSFVMVYVATPPELCEQRDVKGFYAKARAGGMQGMTGVDDPYEAPVDADFTFTTADATPEQSAGQVLELLRQRGIVV